MRNRIVSAILCVMLLLSAFSCAFAAGTDNETAAALVESIAKENFDYFEVEVDEDGLFTCYIGMNGLAAAVGMAKSSGLGADYEPWVTVKDNMVVMYDALKTLLETLKVENPDPLIAVVNEENPDKLLLCLAYGVIIYDVMAED